LIKKHDKLLSVTPEGQITWALRRTNHGFSQIACEAQITINYGCKPKSRPKGKLREPSGEQITALANLRAKHKLRRRQNNDW